PTDEVVVAKAHRRDADDCGDERHGPADRRQDPETQKREEAPPGGRGEALTGKRTEEACGEVEGQERVRQSPADADAEERAKEHGLLEEDGAQRRVVAGNGTR